MISDGIQERESPRALPCGQDRPIAEVLPARIALLTTFISPYVFPVFHHLASSVEHLRIFLSTPMEDDRPWEPHWGGLDVIVQKSFSKAYQYVYKKGLTTPHLRHFPYDVFPLLFRYRPDVVISGQFGFRTVQAAIFRRLVPASRLVIWADLSEHTESQFGHSRTLFRRLLLRAADAVLVNGASGARYLERLGVPSDRIVIAPFSTDMSALMSIPAARGSSAALRLLYVGQLIERKGLEIFLAALVEWSKKYPDRNCEVWFVGDGPLRKTLENFPVPASIGLRFFGNVPYEALPAYYSQVGILVLPTLWDTWALVVNEAMAAGLPIFGSVYSEAVQELVQDGLTGWTFRPDAPDELQRALEQALSSSAPALDAMREAARDRIRYLTPEYSSSQFLRAVRVAMLVSQRKS
ncbi:MAG: glycosyltransferase family 4 protein [Candidatus Acidiferrales bacterium]